MLIGLYISINETLNIYNREECIHDVAIQYLLFPLCRRYVPSRGREFKGVCLDRHVLDLRSGLAMTKKLYQNRHFVLRLLYVQ